MLSFLGLYTTASSSVNFPHHELSDITTIMFSLIKNFLTQEASRISTWTLLPSFNLTITGNNVKEMFWELLEAQSTQLIVAS